LNPVEAESNLKYNLQNEILLFSPQEISGFTVAGKQKFFFNNCSLHYLAAPTNHPLVNIHIWTLNSATLSFARTLYKVDPVNLNIQSHSDNLKLAIPAILITVLALSLGDALIKLESAVFPLWQIFVMRSVIATPFLIYFIRIRTCALPVMPVQFGWTAIRSLILVFMWIAYYLALPRIPLSIAAASFYTLPLFITLFAAIFIGDRVGRKGWFAVLLGFVGVLLVLQPQADDFNAYALLPIFSAICYAFAMIITRSKCQNEKPLVLSLWLNLTFILVGAVAILIVQTWQPPASTIAVNPFLLGGWVPMWIDEWRAMAMLAIAIMIGSVGAAIAYQSGPSSIVATFDFAYVAFAIVWGMLLFGEVPDATIIIGILLIVGGGLIAVRNQ
jgi:drug/metabolite transporter (DMT)-like permease